VSELYIIGDSFAVMKQENINPNVWPILLSQRLGYNLSNTSCSGASQDWLLNQLHQIRKQITPDDQLIITLSDCNRFWFFEDFPDVAEPRATELGEIIGKDRAKAAEYYFRYIQRDSLSINHQISRLGLIAHLTTLYNWKPPIILLSFQEHVPEQELFPNLIFSKGALIYDVSNKELEVGTNDHIFFKGIDVRHNHMCLSNHTILADKLYNQIVNNQPLDLTFGFIKDILKNNYADLEFANKELSLDALEHRTKMLASKSSLSDNWFRRIAM
jgi:hypothetical protein